MKYCLTIQFLITLLNEIKSKQWEDFNDIPDFFRRKAVAAFLLKTGYDSLGKYLPRFGTYGNPNFVLCKSSDIIDSNHKYCSKLTINN